MSSTTIKWSKKYCEDLGTLGQDGYYDYAYRYFLYSFYLPNKYRVVIRNYVDAKLESSVFVYKSNKFDKDYAIDIELISAVLDFMCTEQGIIHFNRFDGEYIPIDLSKLTGNLNKFSFIEIVAKE